MSNDHICKVINDKAHDLQDPYAHVHHTFVADIQLLMPADYIACYQTQKNLGECINILVTYFLYAICIG